MIAVANNLPNIVKLLVDCKNCDLNVRDVTGETAIIKASALEDPTCLHILIQAGASISIPQKDGITPIFLAVHKGREENVRLLLNAGADITVRPSNHESSNR